MNATGKLLLSIIELGGYPNFTPLYHELGYEVAVETRMRKAISFLKRRTPDVIVAEFNFQSDFRDRTSSLESLLARVKTGQRQILLGTQMLAKGHHFPRVTMVGIVDADQGLHSAEFRAPERMAQLILQVAGRAGRADQPGEVYIQTHHLEHPLLTSLINSGYGAFAEELLAERRTAMLPPFTAMALFRAEATGQQAPLSFLQAIREILQRHPQPAIGVYGPMPAPMEKRAGRFRCQLIVQADQRQQLRIRLHHHR